MKGFGVNILAYDIFKDENSSRELDFKYVELEELLEKSDIISLHCPLSKDTEKIINSETISKMKNGLPLKLMEVVI